uniref:Putative secreted protein n=1 Tax=Anopheles darlingi TaxID=43151 RepID=A0A2M4D0Y2_ANODA
MFPVALIRAAAVAGWTLAIRLLNEPTALFRTLLALATAPLMVEFTAAIPAAVYGTAAFAFRVALTAACVYSWSGRLAAV